MYAQYITQPHTHKIQNEILFQKNRCNHKPLCLAKCQLKNNKYGFSDNWQLIIEHRRKQRNEMITLVGVAIFIVYLYFSGPVVLKYFHLLNIMNIRINSKIKPVKIKWIK